MAHFVLVHEQNNDYPTPFENE